MNTTSAVDLSKETHEKPKIIYPHPPRAKSEMKQYCEVLHRNLVKNDFSNFNPPPKSGVKLYPIVKVLEKENSRNLGSKGRTIDRIANKSQMMSMYSGFYDQLEGKREGLGPNHKQKVSHFGPALAETERVLDMKYTLKQKLQQKNVD